MKKSCNGIAEVKYIKLGPAKSMVGSYSSLTYQLNGLMDLRKMWICRWLKWFDKGKTFSPELHENYWPKGEVVTLIVFSNRKQNEVCQIQCS